MAFIYFKTTDAEIFKVDSKIASKFSVISDMLQQLDNKKDDVITVEKRYKKKSNKKNSDHNDVIPVEINSRIFRLVLNYVEHHLDDPVETDDYDDTDDADLIKPEHILYLENNPISKWDEKFIGNDPFILFNLLKAAKYLNIVNLENLASNKISMIFNNNDIPDIVKTLHLSDRKKLETKKNKRNYKIQTDYRSSSASPNHPKNQGWGEATPCSSRSRIRSHFENQCDRSQGSDILALNLSKNESVQSDSPDLVRPKKCAKKAPFSNISRSSIQSKQPTSESSLQRSQSVQPISEKNRTGIKSQRTTDSDRIRRRSQSLHDTSDIRRMTRSMVASYSDTDRPRTRSQKVTNSKK